MPGEFCRCSAEFFRFARRVESVFIKNLTLDIMIAYQEGDLIIKIGEALLENDSIKEDFWLLACDAGLDEDESDAVFVYVINVYLGMRGRWFIRTAKGQESTKSVFTKASTRKKVANAADMSRAKGGSAEKEVYEKAEENILSCANEAEDDAIEEEGMGIDLSSSDDDDEANAFS
mmetsp:Transcript_8929/g.18921  ORF Transcript_8929/g.18921 Transcript_8929/m.18921 type:complete len:175 (-) Transcript_8929:138-662(-)